MVCTNIELGPLPYSTPNGYVKMGNSVSEAACNLAVVTFLLYRNSGQERA